MSVTYTDTTETTSPLTETSFTPVYARRGARKKTKGVKTWMVLAPIGAIVLVGGAAAMMISGDEAVAPIEATTATPVAVQAPLVEIPASNPPIASVATPPPARIAARQPVPEAAPVRRSAPVATRRSAPATPAVAARVATAPTPPVEAVGPRPYTAAPSATTTQSVTAAPIAAPTPVAPPAPITIVPPIN